MQHTNRPKTAPDRRRRHAAFTIIEMLVVVAIIALIVAILLPAIGGVRRAAGNSKTLTTITDLTQASQVFLNDNRRLPGYFSVEEMADTANHNRGFPMMANILLDLSGGFIEAGEPVPTGLDSIEDVGPNGRSIVTVLPERIGADEGVGAAKSLYYAPDPSALKLQNADGAMAAAVLPQHSEDLPHFVDAFGTPLLAWAESDTISPEAEFASTDRSATARFYWVSNGAFLGGGATLVGRKAMNQFAESLLGGEHPESDRIKTMQALLGNPTYPDTQTPPEPASSRGKLIFHSAGPNGVYIGEDESAAKREGGDALTYTGKDDPMRRSDDVIRSLGN